MTIKTGLLETREIRINNISPVSIPFECASRENDKRIRHFEIAMLSHGLIN